MALIDMLRLVSIATTRAAPAPRPALRLLRVAVPVAAFGCDGASEPVGPTAESESLTEASTEVSSPVAQSLITGDRCLARARISLHITAPVFRPRTKWQNPLGP